MFGCGYGGGGVSGGVFVDKSKGRSMLLLLQFPAMSSIPIAMSSS